MKKFTSILLAVCMFMAFAACAKDENKADTSLKDGEIMISGRVIESYGNSLLLEEDENENGNAGRFFVAINEYTLFVEEGWYVTDLSADSLEGKRISVICNETILETYPAQLQDERMIIILS